MHENVGYMLAVIGTDAATAAAAGEPLTVSQIVGYIIAAVLGGGAAYKVIPILVARLAVSAAGAKSEKDAIERLEGQLAVERQAAQDARNAANDAFKQRNDIYMELAKVQAQLAALAERSNFQAQTIERQNSLIAELTAQVRNLQEDIRGKTA
ncbi:hypothetical protein LMG3410_04887 [Achromobacter aegrifaciens]|uniref:hypothetical protein n=1 Tax=Achromobacter aegrifaciens TaxID=1287736 RepID=UPI0014651725|nr:hypothetical protein [Achromobacter aegrifaciens]CAB3912086.1 hypothetical protein LMG3410_04887 [Achromobacter aegrifaciens]